ncbi:MULTISPECIES: energy transducer TonB [Desulfovibrio]|uniref:Protein TonB n=2 Tax=Desulfovibrio desulfuricans TaxID=876 RepID=A0AA94L3L3_DESDE|nr:MULTISPECIES: energy transducer TonB [Desulfovibrio]ATD81288.1 energy transducer TonB [Desulfovibrio sp. G11]MDY0202700.1 TonB family protein [Desulfovibrio desulfuricans]SFW75075.1 protein TonB [Desulfovibrio desulfuricans]SPD36922.1 TonB-dependent transporter [Desulfovibrio sp. G11]
MKVAARGTTLFFSLGMHSLLLGGLLFLARETPNTTERVYRVALAEFAPTPSLPPPQAAAEPPAPPPPPAPKKQEVQPQKPVEPKPDVKKISPKKNNVPLPKEQAAPPRPEALTPPAPAGPQPRTVGGFSAYESDSLDQRPSITRRVVPEYPIKARRMNVQGSVKVRLVVDSSGQPRNCEIISATPDGYFEEAALKAAQRMRFAPGKLKGQPVNTLVVIPFAFSLR